LTFTNGSRRDDRWWMARATNLADAALAANQHRDVAGDLFDDRRDRFHVSCRPRRNARS
jgi:hypothetical protein